MTHKNTAETVWEYVKVIGSALILALTIRFFFVEPYKIPSGSMVPTLLVGDYLFVNKMSYNTRIPFTDVFLRETAPKRGEISVFKKNDTGLQGSLFGLSDTFLIKRIVAVPGDKIAYIGKRLYVNNKPADVTEEGKFTYTDSMRQEVSIPEYQETVGGFQHSILVDPYAARHDVAAAIVPADHYVLMGDNRDNSRDARYWNAPLWGFVHKKDLIGRAEFIFWSWQHDFKPRFERLLNGLRPTIVDEAA